MQKPPLTEEHRILADAGVSIEPGLTDSELHLAQAVVGAPFPPDLRAFLAAGLPAGNGFPNWRNPRAPELREHLDTPPDGILFDVEHNAFWWHTWGQRPTDLVAAVGVASEMLRCAPRLIPLFRHRFLPAAPNLPGNPVLSVHQTDIIHYGSSLGVYLRLEFHVLSYEEANAQLPRHVPFWSEFMNPEPLT